MPRTGAIPTQRFTFELIRERPLQQSISGEVLNDITVPHQVFITCAPRCGVYRGKLLFWSDSR
jgi:hypothetical protein